MKNAALLLLLACLVSAGCGADGPGKPTHACAGKPPVATDAPPSGEGDLAVAVGLATAQLVTGQSLDVTVTVTNRTDSTIEIDSLTSAKVYVFIWRYTIAGWTETLRYPQAEAMVVTPWSIDAGESVTFDMPLVVEPTWPTYEPLRLTVAINGTDAVSLPIAIKVTSPAD